MGGSSSKVSRKLPSKPSAAWAGARTDRSAASRLPRNAPVPNETKNASIEMDAGDPDFMEKLKQLGPVKVDHHMSTVRVDDHMKRVLLSREASEQQAASYVLPRNRVRASELLDALKRRKVARSREELQEIANHHNMDVNALERIARFTNAPSTVEETRQEVVDEEGKERFTVLVAWEDPLIAPRSSNSTKSPS